jgi:hypothetical protein
VLVTAYAENTANGNLETGWLMIDKPFIMSPKYPNDFRWPMPERRQS